MHNPKTLFCQERLLSTSWCERTSKFTVRTVKKCTSLRLYYSQRLQCQTHNFVQYKINSFVPVAPYPDPHKNHGSGSWTQGFIKYYKRQKNLFTHETLPLNFIFLSPDLLFAECKMTSILMVLL